MRFVCDECKSDHHTSCDNITRSGDRFGTWCDCQHGERGGKK